MKPRIRRRKVELFRGFTTWEPHYKHQPKGFTLDVRAITTREPWSPPQTNGWIPKLTTDGKWIAYGFWETFIANLETGETRQITLPEDNSGRMHPAGWITDDALLCIAESPARAYIVRVTNFKPVRIDLPEHLAQANWSSASHGSWCLHSSNRPHATLNGTLFETQHRQQGAVCAGVHFVTADPDSGYQLFHYRDRQFVRALPPDNQWIVNEHGDILTGYFGPVTIHPFNGPTQDATITPWRGEGSAGAIVRVGESLWIWTPTEIPGHGNFIIGRRLGEKDPIMLPLPAVSAAAVLVRDTWIVAGNDDRGRLKVMWCPISYERTNLSTLVKPVDPNKPDPKEPAMAYRSFRDYFDRRWAELRVQERTEEAARRVGLDAGERKALKQLSEMRKEAERTKKRFTFKVSPKMAASEAAFKAIQVGALVQIASELHHTHGNKDVGLSTKNSGNNFALPDGRKIAGDILTIKPTDTRGNVVAGNFQLVDVIVSVGSADAKPAWQVLGQNTDSKRPWMEPPAITKPDEPEEPEPEPEPEEKHEFIGSGRFCPQCGKESNDPVHQMKPPDPEPSDDTATVTQLKMIVARLDSLILEERATREAVVKALKEVGENMPNLGDILRRKK